LLLFFVITLIGVFLPMACSVDMNRDRPDNALQDQRPDMSADTYELDVEKRDQQPDKVPLGDGPAADHGADLGVVLASGGFSTGGPGSGGSILLVEGGFEGGERLCVSTKNICIVGGIAP